MPFEKNVKIGLKERKCKDFEDMIYILNSTKEESSEQKVRKSHESNTQKLPRQKEVYEKIKTMKLFF